MEVGSPGSHSASGGGGEGGERNGVPLQYTASVHS